MDQIALLAEACALTQRQVDAAMALPNAATGCELWSASELVNHTVVTLGMWADIMSGDTPQIDPFNPPHVLGDDMASDFRSATARAIAAFSVDGVMDQVFASPAGELPGSALITFPTYDMYLHSWDLAQATGLEGEYPDHLTALAMGFSQQAFSEERPPQIVGPAVDIADSATPFAKLLAFNGRQP